MIPKRAFNKVKAALRKMKADWDEDRAEDPARAPYEIDSQLRRSIEGACREEGYRFYKEDVDGCIEYLIKAGILQGSPYGGTFFPIDEKTIPTKKELLSEIKGFLE